MQGDALGDASGDGGSAGRVKAKKGLQVVGARPGDPTHWSTQLERTRGPKHSTAVVTCRRSGDGRGGWR